MQRTTLVVLTAALTTSALYAQGRFERGLEPMMHQWKVVTGAPYSATVTNTFVQTLADGNKIQRTTSAQVARDSQGRVYTQQTFTGGPLAQNGPVTLTFITDPVAGYSYVLNPNTKIATRRTFKTPPAPPNGGGPGSGFAGRHSSSSNVVTTQLGTQLVNGVNAKGTSITRTIPAGAMGNAQPIVSTSQTWYSPDLQIVVAAQRNDPRFGQSSYAVTNIQRGDPNSALFQIPSDYTVQDASTMHERWRGGPPSEIPQ